MTAGGGGVGPDPGRLHLSRPVRRPRPDLRQDDGHARHNVSPADLLQARSPALDLDSLYGAGPRRPRVGEVLQADGIHLKMGKTEARRRDPRQGRLRPAAPRRRASAAIIPDPRNDENLAVAQTHLAMIRFHNRVVDSAAAPRPGRPALRPGARDRSSSTTSGWSATTTCRGSAGRGGRQRVQQRPQGVRVGATPTDVPTMPIEFSVAGVPARPQHDPARLQLEQEFLDDGAGTLDFLFAFSGTSGNLGGGSRLPSNWIADWRRLYDFAETGRTNLGPRAAKFNRARRIDTLLVDPLNPARGSFGGQSSPTRARSAQPRVPQPHARADGQARHRAADGDVPEEQGRQRPPADEGADPRRQTAARARRAHAGTQRDAVLEGHAAVVLRPARGGAQQRPAEGRRRADRRRDVPPRDRGQPASRSCATRRGRPRSARTTRPSGWATCCCSRSRARRRCSPRWVSGRR